MRERGDRASERATLQDWRSERLTLQDWRSVDWRAERAWPGSEEMRSAVGARGGGLVREMERRQHLKERQAFLV